MTSTGFFLLVGGEGRRMGGKAKALLKSPSGEAIWLRLDQQIDGSQLRLSTPSACRFFVGNRSEFSDLKWQQIPDDTRCEGPLSGLLSALQFAEQRFSEIVVLAGDLPHIDANLLNRLAKPLPPGVDVVAPRDNDFWMPLFSRYRCESSLVAAQKAVTLGKRSLQNVLKQLNCAELQLSPEQHEKLRDWDSPDDIKRDTLKP